MDPIELHLECTKFLRTTRGKQTVKYVHNWFKGYAARKSSWWDKFTQDFIRNVLCCGCLGDQNIS